MDSNSMEVIIDGQPKATREPTAAEGIWESTEPGPGTGQAARSSGQSTRPGSIPK